MFTLSDVDRQAVELFLESRRGSHSGSGRVPARFAEVSLRVEAVGKLFDMLGILDETDPPGDLVSRVLKAAEGRPARWQVAPVQPGEPPVARPHA